MCRFIESIRIENGIARALSLHTERMNRTRAFFWPSCKQEDIRDYLTDLPEKGLYKCRIVYDSEIRTVEYIPYSIRPVSTLRLVCSDTIDYRFKSTDRSAFQLLGEQKNGADDILIVKNGRLTDTSIGNIALFDGKEWVTPDTPLLKGICRQGLLHNDIIRTANLQAKDIWNFTVLRIFNAMIDFGALEIPVDQEHILISDSLF